MPRINTEVLHRAKERGATPAIELVGERDDVQAALQYAFGTTMVCKVRADNTYADKLNTMGIQFFQ